MTESVLSYAIDEQDRLVKLDEGYYRFAEENGWPGAGTTLGRSLWDFVSGSELRKLQRLLLRRIRDEVRAVELPFRCDGPDVRREMRLTIVARPPGRLVLFAARIDAETPREEFQPLLDPESSRGEELIEMCGWCDRFEVGGEWVEVEDAAARLRLFAGGAVPSISHGVCPSCAALLKSA